MRRHWQLACCAFPFCCYLQGHASAEETVAGSRGGEPPAREAWSPAFQAGREKRVQVDAFSDVVRHWRYVNAQAERIMGKTREELLGKVVWEVRPTRIGSTFF
jgi:PAS domain-containing protein